jgi:hypothetical protein
VVHVWQDVVALLLIPAHPSPPPATEGNGGTAGGRAASALPNNEVRDQPAPPLPHLRSRVPD